MANINRRAFLAVGAGVFALPAIAAISDATDRTSRRKRINFKASL